MAVVGVEPIFMGSASLVIGADDYTAAVSRVTISPSPQWLSGRMFGGAPYHVLAWVDWSCRVDIVQDWSEGSLCRYLASNAGQEATVAFVPESGGASVTVGVVLAPPAVGGGAAEILTSSVDWPVVSDPVYS